MTHNSTEEKISDFCKEIKSKYKPVPYNTIRFETSNRFMCRDDKYLYFNNDNGVVRVQGRIKFVLHQKLFFTDNIDIIDELKDVEFFYDIDEKQLFDQDFLQVDNEFFVKGAAMKLYEKLFCKFPRSQSTFFENSQWVRWLNATITVKSNQTINQDDINDITCLSFVKEVIKEDESKIHIILKTYNSTNIPKELYDSMCIYEA